MFSEECFCKKNISKTFRPFLATVSVNSLTSPYCLHVTHFKKIGHFVLGAFSVATRKSAITSSMSNGRSRTFREVPSRSESSSRRRSYSNITRRCFKEVEQRAIQTHSPRINRGTRTFSEQASEKDFKTKDIMQ